MTEEELGAAMLALARKEGHAPQPFYKKGGPKKASPPRKLNRTAGPETVTIMRCLTKGPANTRALAAEAGLTVDQASWRLKSLRRGGYVDIIGRVPATTCHVCVWALSKRAPRWLKAHGIDVEAAE